VLHFVGIVFGGGGAETEEGVEVVRKGERVEGSAGIDVELGGTDVGSRSVVEYEVV